MLTFGSFFSGIGLLDYGLHLAGIEHAWFCEADPWRREILKRRWPGRPVYDDIRNVGADTAVRVDGIVGGFPCKGASTAGLRNGFDHAETVLWREMARAVRELRPRYVVVENVANILALHDGAVWGEVLGDLAALGFDVEWDCIPAGAVGAPHLRDRVFAVATDAEELAEREPADQAHAEPRSGHARPITGGGAGRAPTDAAGGRGQGSRGARAALGRAEADATEPLADAVGDGVRQQPEPEPGCSGPAVAGRSAEDAADPRGAGREERDGALAGGSPHAALADRAEDAQDADSGTAQPAGGERRGEPQGAGRPVAVDWGDYRAAIERWERALGRPAGEPLLSGVVARGARGVVRSRLSALGDGVQVQVGEIVGAYILEREGRLAA